MRTHSLMAALALGGSLLAGAAVAGPAERHESRSFEQALREAVEDRWSLGAWRDDEFDTDALRSRERGTRRDHGWRNDRGWAWGPVPGHLDNPWIKWPGRGDHGHPWHPPIDPPCAPVPEPGPLALLAAGFGALAFLRRRRG